MKKVISIILVTILSFIGTNFVFAENDNDTLSVEVIPMENNISNSSENNIINDEQVEETIDIKNNDEQVEDNFENQNNEWNNDEILNLEDNIPNNDDYHNEYIE